MINILSVISELNFGGGENRLLNLARSIDPKRFRLTVATLYSKGDSSHCGTLRDQFAEAGVRMRELALPHPSGFQAIRPVKLANTASTLATAIARLRRLILETRADAVDAHLESALYTAVPAAASAFVPAAVTLYSELDLWKLFDGNSYRRVFFPPVRRMNLRTCGLIFTDSRARADELQGFVGDSPRVVVVPNGVRLDKPALTRAEVLRKFAIPEETRATIVGQVAGLVPFKGAAVLLAASQRAIAKGHDLYVLCVGDARMGPAYPAQLRQQAEQLGISDRVRIQGYPGHIADVWSVIDIHVHASSIDSLPNAVIEGMSLGKPAVVSAVGAVPEHVDDGQTGLLVPPDDPAAAAEALLRLLDDRAFAARLGAGAQRRYLERFTPEITTRAIEGHFEAMIDGFKSRRAAAR